MCLLLTFDTTLIGLVCFNYSAYILESTIKGKRKMYRKHCLRLLQICPVRQRMRTNNDGFI